MQCELVPHVVLLDMAPMGAYDVYMRQFASACAAATGAVEGGDQRAQASTQTGVEQQDTDVQTDVASVTHRWTQHPALGADAGMDSERAGGRGSKRRKPTAFDVAAAAQQQQRLAQQQAVRLAAFMARTVPTVETLLHEAHIATLDIAPTVDEEGHDGDCLDAPPLPLPSSYTRSVCACTARDRSASWLATAWWSLADDASFVCIHRQQHAAAMPQLCRVLQCAGHVTTVALAHGMRPVYVFAGTATGSVYVWDLRESNIYQQSSNTPGDGDGGVVYAPSFSTNLLSASTTPASLTLLCNDRSTRRHSHQQDYVHNAHQTAVLVPDERGIGHHAPLVRVACLPQTSTKHRVCRVSSVDQAGVVCCWVWLRRSICIRPAADTHTQMVVEQTTPSWTGNDVSDASMGIGSRIKLVQYARGVACLARCGMHCFCVCCTVQTGGAAMPTRGVGVWVC